MSLDVLLRRPLVPSQDDLKDAESRSHYEEEHDCWFHIFDDKEEAKSIEKLKGTPWLLRYQEDLIDWDATIRSLGLDPDEWWNTGWCYSDDSFELGRKAVTMIKEGEEPVDGETPKSWPTKDDYKRFPISKLVTNPGMVYAICTTSYTTRLDIGWVRRGANAQFYEDGKWDNDTIVVTRENLLEDWKKYFQEVADEFKTKIVDPFIEGEMVVCYW